jgi:hypothetical protein
MDTTLASNTRVIHRLLAQLNAPLGAHASSARSHWDKLPEDLALVIRDQAAAMRQKDADAKAARQRKLDDALAAHEWESNSWNRKMEEHDRRIRAWPRERAETCGLDESEDFHDWMLENTRDRLKADKRQTFDHLDGIDDEYEDDDGLPPHTYRGPSHKQVCKTHKATTKAHNAPKAGARPRYQPEHAQQARGPPRQDQDVKSAWVIRCCFIESEKHVSPSEGTFYRYLRVLRAARRPLPEVDSALRERGGRRGAGLGRDRLGALRDEAALVGDVPGECCALEALLGAVSGEACVDELLVRFRALFEVGGVLRGGLGGVFVGFLGVGLEDGRGDRRTLQPERLAAFALAWGAGGARGVVLHACAVYVGCVFVFYIGLD